MIFLLVACAQQPISGYSTNETYWVELESSPAPIPFNEEFSLTVSVYKTDKSTPFDSTLNIDIDAQMPEHDHGMNQRPITEPTNSGIVADGFLFHMTGDWTFDLSIEVEGEPQSREVVVIPYLCCK